MHRSLVPLHAWWWARQVGEVEELGGAVGTDGGELAGVEGSGDVGEGGADLVAAVIGADGGEDDVDAWRRAGEAVSLRYTYVIG
jgi:hypothetical protein